MAFANSCNACIVFGYSVRPCVHALYPDVHCLPQTECVPSISWTLHMKVQGNHTFRKHVRDALDFENALLGFATSDTLNEQSRVGPNPGLCSVGLCVCWFVTVPHLCSAECHSRPLSLALQSDSAQSATHERAWLHTVNFLPSLPFCTLFPPTF